jgi:hypothetical protein
MKNFILSILLHLICLSAFCQVDTASLKIMEAVFRNEQPKETLYYTDRIRKDNIKQIKEAFKGTEYSWWVEGHVRDTIRLTKKEKKYLDSCLDKLVSLSWQDSLFENAGRIPLDSTWRHQLRRFKECVDTTADGQIKIKGNNISHTNVFSFSYPAFIRDRSVFLLYFVRHCYGDCGVEELYFYRKENGVYKKWILVTGGVF